MGLEVMIKEEENPKVREILTLLNNAEKFCIEERKDGQDYIKDAGIKYGELINSKKYNGEYNYLYNLIGETIDKVSKMIEERDNLRDIVEEKVVKLEFLFEKQNPDNMEEAERRKNFEFLQEAVKNYKELTKNLKDNHPYISLGNRINVLSNKFLDYES